MSKTFGILLAVVLGLVAVLTPSSALAQRGGSGGGGGGGGGGSVSGTPLIFGPSISINGSVPGWSGDFTLTNSIPGYYTWATVSLNIKGKPINLPDNSTMNVTLFTSDQVTGLPLDPVSATALVVLSKTGLSKSKLTIYNYGGQNITRQLDWVVITAPDGTIIVSGHP